MKTHRSNKSIQIILSLVMGLMITYGNELIRFNPANGHLEYSTSRGANWNCRCSSNSIGNVKGLIQYGNELILCSDKGVFYSTSKGANWNVRCSSHKDFIDIQDAGKELLGSTADGHLYYSTSKGANWNKRR